MNKLRGTVSYNRSPINVNTKNSQVDHTPEQQYIITTATAASVYLLCIPKCITIKAFIKIRVCNLLFISGHLDAMLKSYIVRELRDHARNIGLLR